LIRRCLPNSEHSSGSSARPEDSLFSGGIQHRNAGRYGMPFIASSTQTCFVDESGASIARFSHAMAFKRNRWVRLSIIVKSSLKTTIDLK
jgi:hypothetical protein